MMTLDNSRRAVAIAMDDLERRVKAEGSIRNTTGKIFDEMRSSVTSGTDYITGTLEANDYWIYVGSGRGPNKAGPWGSGGGRDSQLLESIRDWIQRAGLTLNAWVVARKIANEGTRAWREKRPNVFLTAIEAWQDGPALADVERAGIQDMERASVEVLVNAFRK